MKLVLTGSCGLICSKVVRYYDKRAEPVFGIDNNMRAEFSGENGYTTWLQGRIESECPMHKHESADIRSKCKTVKYYLFKFSGRESGVVLLVLETIQIRRCSRWEFIKR